MTFALIQSLIIAFSALLKGSNVTEKWIESRLEQVQTMLLLTEDLHIERNAILSFDHNFGLDLLTVHTGYTVVLSLYVAIPAEIHPPFRNLIEQARSANNAGLSLIAQICSQGDKINLVHLMDQVGKITLFQAGKAMALAMMFPYDSLKRPLVEASTYSDLKTIAYEIIVLSDPTTTFRNLKGASHGASNKLPAASLKAIARAIHGQLTASALTFSSKEDILSRLVRADVVSDAGGETFSINLESTVNR